MSSFIQRNCIESKPKFNLKDCLSHYNKHQLMDIANKQHLLLNMGAPIKAEELIKKQVINSLITHMSMNFSEDLFYIPPRELKFISQLLKTDFPVIIHIDERDCNYLHALGYVYLYYYNGQVYPVVPKELRKIYKEIPKKAMDYDIKLNKELYTYAAALTQLYGIYTVEYFIEVWNLHHEDPEYFLDFEEASMYFYMMYDRQNYFNYDYQYVVANYPRGNDLYKLLDLVKDKPYPIPTKDEIELYSKEKLSIESPYYKKLSKII